MARALGFVAVAMFSLVGCREMGAGSAPGALSAFPTELDFGPTGLGYSSEIQVRISNQGRAPFRIYEVRPSIPNVEVYDFSPVDLFAGDDSTLTIRFKPEVEGQVTGVVEVVTDADSGGQGVLRLPLAGHGVPAKITLEQRFVDFGDVELDTVKMGELTARNDSQAKAQLRFSLDGPDADLFSSAEFTDGATLAPGELRKVSIAFRPSRMGAAVAIARAEVCPSCEAIPIELTGSGVTSMLDVTPLRVDFGKVSVGATVEDRVLVRNLGNESLPFSGAELLSNATGAFQIVRAPSPGNLAPGGTLEVVVSFSPKEYGAFKGTLLRLGITAPNTASTGPKISLVGEGGQNCIVTLPQSLDFGLVPEGMSHTQDVEVLNRCRGEVQLSSLGIATSAGGFFSLGQATTAASIPAGGTTRIPLTFTPRSGSGASAGALTFKAYDGTSISYERVSLAGSTRKFEACSYELAPTSLDFGQVPVGAEVTLGLAVTNRGTDSCFLARTGLASGSDPEFRITPPSSPLIAPGARAILLVTFKPSAQNVYGALAEAWVNHPTAGHITAPVGGEGATTCFALQPTTVDFGKTKLGCAARSRQLLAVNGCSTSVSIDALGFVQGDSSDFRLATGTLPRTLQPGESATFDSSYEPAAEGLDAATLQVRSSQGDRIAGFVADAVQKPFQTDRFIQDPQSKVDVLFVIDNSGSMMEEQQSLADNFKAFLSAAQAQGIDYHVAVTTTGIESSPGGWSACPGGADGGENGRLFPADNSSQRIIDLNTPDAEAVFARNVKVGWCHWHEQGLLGAYRALSDPLLSRTDDARTALANDGNAGFLRADAKLAIVFVTDEEDFSPESVSFYDTYFRALKNNDPSMLSVSVIGGPEDLSSCPTASSTSARYLALARATGGVIESICTPNWAESLKNLAQTAFGAKRKFRLSQLPDDAAQIVVEVNDAAVTTGWHYDAADNSINFTAETTPPSGSVLEVTYPLGC